MKMNRYVWSSWDFPICKFTMYFGTEMLEIPDIAYSQPLEYDWDGDY